MDPGLLIPLALAVAFGSVYLVNEWSEGTLADALGLGPGHHVHAAVQDACLGDPEGGPCEATGARRALLVSARPLSGAPA